MDPPQENPTPDSLPSQITAPPPVQQPPADESQQENPTMDSPPSPISTPPPTQINAPLLVQVQQPQQPHADESQQNPTNVAPPPGQHPVLQHLQQWLIFCYESYCTELTWMVVAYACVLISVTALVLYFLAEFLRLLEKSLMR